MPAEGARPGITEEVLVFLLAGGQGERLWPLTRDRAKPAVPFAAHYRIVDFTLSNAIHSGLRRIYVLSQYRSLSLERHVKEGYSFLPCELGEFIDTVPPQFRTSSHWYQGTADAVYQNIYLLENDRPRRTLVLSGDHVYRLDYRDMLRAHIERRADMTIGVIEVPIEEARRMGVLAVDDEGWVVGFEEKPEHPKPIPGRPDRALASMGIYLFETETLVREVSRDAKRDSTHDFGRDVVPQMVEGGRRIHAFPLREKDGSPGYWRDVGTIDAYFEAHRDVLGERPAFDLRRPDWPWFTNVLRLPAAEVRRDGEAEPRVEDSVLASGTEVRGATVRRSFLGPNTVVEAGAVLEDCILLGRSRIGRGARLRRAIVDADNSVPEGFLLEEHAGDFPRSPGGVVVVPQRTPFS